MPYPTPTQMGTSMPRRKIPSSDSKIMRLRLESGRRFLALGVSSFVAVAFTARLSVGVSDVTVAFTARLSVGVSDVTVVSTARLSVGVSGAAVVFAAGLSVGLSGDVTDIKISPGSGHDESHPYR